MRRSQRWLLAAGLFLALFTPVAFAESKIDCESIQGFDEFIVRAKGAVVGDMHGTIEAPKFLATLTCNLVASGRSIVLALEYPRNEQNYLDDFLNRTSDLTRATNSLLASPFWRRPTQDGRTSKAMLEFLVDMRARIKNGDRIRVVAYDDLSAMGFEARDQSMAQFLKDKFAKATRGQFTLVFTGNVHARKTKGLPFLDAPPEMKNAEPLGYRLKDLQFVHLNIAYSGGALWSCTPACGVHEIGLPAASATSFEIRKSGDEAYDGEYFVGALTASEPATSLVNQKHR